MVNCPPVELEPDSGKKIEGVIGKPFYVQEAIIVLNRKSGRSSDMDLILSNGQCL
jgi:hypothetical protein